MSYIQVGSQALSKSWQKVAHTVSAAAASVSASAAARRGTATVPFPAACTAARGWMILGCVWALQRGGMSWWWSCWLKSCGILQLAADLRRSFSGKGVLNSILVSVLCSFILLRGEVLGEIERSVVFKVHC